MNACLKRDMQRVWPAIFVGFAVLVLLMGSGDECWAQTMNWGTGRDLSEPTDFSLWIKVFGLLLAIATSYALAFLVIFPTIIRKGTGPLRSYGMSWAIFVFACTLAIIAFFFEDMLPKGWNNLTSFGKMYWRHAVVGGVGLALAGLMLFFYRSPVDSPM